MSTTFIPASDAQRPRVALVIGATGAFGGHTAAALSRHGWRVRALARDPAAAAAKAGAGLPIEWVRGDAMVPASVIAATEGADLIVHAANPPAYRNWAGTVLPMAQSAIEAAKASGARLLVPASVYNFAPDAGAAIGEETPHKPVTRKGALRVELEARLRAASAEGVRVLVLRAGDFFGPGPANSALDWLVLRGLGRPQAIFRPGPGGVGRAFAYLPDLAETAALLLDREAELGAYDVFHFAGHFLTLDELVRGVRKATGRPRLPAIPFPWSLARVMGRWNETLRELLEMRYLWLAPIGFSNRKLVGFLGFEPRTPLDAALREALGEPPVTRTSRVADQRASFHRQAAKAPRGA